MLKSGTRRFHLRPDLQMSFCDLTYGQGADLVFNDNHKDKTDCRQIANISHTKSQDLHVSRLVLQMALCNLLKPYVKSIMKM